MANLKNQKIYRRVASKSRIILYSVLCLAIAATIYFVFFRGDIVSAAWMDESWLYRKAVQITNSGTAQTDYQVSITLDTAALYTAGKIQIDCDDIRVTDTNGKILPH